jgi:uncharacterized membrane protein YraQ (UPF0718 family)
VPIAVRRPKGNGPFPAITMGSGEGKGGMPQVERQVERLAAMQDRMIARGYVVAYHNYRNEIPYLYEKLQGTFMEKNKIVFKSALRDSLTLFRQVFLYLLIGAGIGAFIYGYVPEDFLINITGKANMFSIPIAAIIGIPMYVRTETMIPIASILISKGVSSGAMIAFIIGGAGASIPELSMLASIFKKKMMAAFVIAIFVVAVITGFAFDFIL